MRINKSLTNDELERLYEDIDSEVIFLPVNFKKLRLGLLPRLCQILITSLKYNSNKMVKFYQFDSSLKENSINDFLEHPESLTALLMSSHVYEKDRILNNIKKNVELKSKINKQIQKRLDKSVFEKTHRIQMFAVDHSVEKYAFPSCFYFPEGTNLLNNSDFYTLLLGRIIKKFHPRTEITLQEIDSLSLAIQELIENTEQHGKNEFNTGKVKRSVRGLIIDYKFIKKSAEIEEIAGQNTPITEYLNSLQKTKGSLHILEISIFDSGEGILKTFNSNQNISFEEEIKVVEKSFAKGETSKVEHQGYGRGLHNVRTILNKRSGFLSLRTGRVSLYRDFKTNLLTEDDITPLSLYDEFNRSKNEYKELHHVEGLAISILVPLR